MRESRNDYELHETDRLDASLLEVPKPRRKPLGRVLREKFNMQVEDTEWREIAIGTGGKFDASGYPRNEINNRRYSLLTFVPMSLFNQFRLFFNIFFLAVAVSQFVPMLQVGFIFIYFAPLAFVVSLSMAKEAADDLQRWWRDRKANSEQYETVQEDGSIKVIPASEIRVGTLLQIHSKQRIPADCILLHTTEKSGASFVRTDQLDGETDWKLRFPIKLTQGMSISELAATRMNIKCEPLHKDIYAFKGNISTPSNRSGFGVSLENTLWSSCVVASGTVVAVVIHTGADCRCAMNAAKPSTKTGLLDEELNRICGLCLFLLVLLSLLLVAQQKFQGQWIVMLVRFIILLSAIIPISMRVNIDVARIWYSVCMALLDRNVIPGTIVRNMSIPEELGRLSYLFSDKTGTLTKNVMEFRCLQLGPQFVLQHRDEEDFHQALSIFFGEGGREGRKRSNVVGYGQQQINEIGTGILALALCHNVTPVRTEEGLIEFQASSPDEVAMVKFASTVGVHLHDRTLKNITLKTPANTYVTYNIIKMFPFSSERKCMSIILQEEGSSNFLFLMKGADVKMCKVISKCEWLDESCQEMAQKGLRTLVFAQRIINDAQVHSFLAAHEKATATMDETRDDKLEAAMNMLESQMELVAVTGVEDQLQDDVTLALETLGACGLRVWMLTGDKVETATCIGRSTQLIPRNSNVEFLLSRSHDALATSLHTLRQTYDPAIVGEFSAKWALVMDGTCLAMCLEPEFETQFVDVARMANSVIVARCSPTQKAAVVHSIKKHSPSNVRTAAIGDGGNDVSMILAAHVGIGVEGVEGKQASMAADFSITKFHHCLRLIMWHGRNSYKRSCHLSQFIMHRGIVYSVVQAVFSVMFAGSTMSVFNGYLLMGYATVFTMAPVFAIVLDEDHKEDAISEFPQLYKELLKGRSLSLRSFLQWVWISFFQGGVMMYLTLDLFSDEMFQIVSIAFTALLITELVIVAAVMHFRILWQQRRRHFFLFVLAEMFSLLAFFMAVLLLPNTFDRAFFFSAPFAAKVSLICLASIGPIFALWVANRFIGPYVLKLCFGYRAQARLSF